MHQAMGGRLPGCVHNNNNNVMHHPSLSTIVMLSRAPTNKLHWPCIRPAHHCKVVAPVCRAPPRSYLAATAALTTTQAQAATQINLVTDVLLPTTTITPLAQDLCATLFAAIGAYALVKMFDALAERRVFDQKLSRKLVHLSAGPLFMLSWVLFSPEPYTRYLAALVPCLQALRLIAVGTGWLNSPNTVRAVSRGGDRSELLRGPLYYVLILVAITAIFWRENPIGVVALSLMCGGDGLADIIGRRFGGNNKLPYNESKSLSGSLAMFAGRGGVMF